MNNETLKYYSCLLQEYFDKNGMHQDWAIFLNAVINCLIVAFVIFLVDRFIRTVIIEGFKTFSDKSATTYDDYLVKSNFPKYIAHFAPLTIIWYVAPIIFMEYPAFLKIFLHAIDIYTIILSVYIFRSILRTTRHYGSEIDKFKDKPLDSYVQVMMIFAWGLAIILIVQILTGHSLMSLGTLGAASAVILLIFKDTILGFVASIQVSVNDIVRIGDWITFSKFGADGYVTEINLATVKVMNFDNTFTTIPTYSLIADSFQNWRGMQESKGRRIKRSIFIKQTSIKFLTDGDIERLKKIQLIQPYLDYREKENVKFNTKTEANKDVLINGRNQTNLGVFRNYAEAFLQENPAINKDLFFMVRHLAPTDKGIPIEIFCFSYDKAWENYEHIQADIFDHLLAAVPYFDLEIFELPTGKDFARLN